ncbi:hypothetical protein JCM10207_000306 [Rhodosporidiobolus poonsookiae]
MLTDISNTRQPGPASPHRLSAAPLANNNKRPLPPSSDADGLLPTTLKHFKRDLTSTSSSSSPAPSSPFFASTRLDAFNAPSSPSHSSLKVPTSPVRRLPALNSLPPSSPSFGLASSTTQDVLASEAASVIDEPTPAQSHKHDFAADAPRILHLERGSVLYFGRKAKKAIPRPSSTEATVGSETYLPVLLPKSAKNASRLHCSARLLPAEDEDKVMVELRVTGMNGMKIDGKLYRQGSIAHLTVEPGRRVKLQFWGADVLLIVAESEISLDSDSDDGDVTVEEEEGEEVRAASPAPVRADRPKSAHASRAPSPALPSSQQQLSTSLPAVPSAAAARAAALVSSLALDLPGLIASAIVFHPRATVAVDEIARALLRETGALWRVLSEKEEEVERRRETQDGEDEAVEAWREIVEDTLEDEEMFGRIDNSGLKDAAGHPIPSAYFYIPDADPSRERVAALEPFVKRVRGARAKGGVQYFWAKPSLRKNR